MPVSLKHMMLATFLLVTCNKAMANEATSAAKIETVKIQISNSGIKPWLSFTDGDARTSFNTAVHGQALYFTPDMNIHPGYIKSWKWDFKDKKYVFKIDTSQKYSNGKAISAADFEFVLIKPFISPIAGILETIPLSFILGTEKLKKGMKYQGGMVEGIKVIGNDEVHVKLKSGHSRFLYALGPVLPPLAPKDSFQDDLYTFKGLPIGSGPYKVVYSDPQSSMVRIQRVAPGKSVEFIEFYSDKLGWENKVDLALGGGVSHMKDFMKDHSGAYRRIVSSLPNSIEVLEFNFQTEAGSSQNFREAVALALDKEQEIPGFPAKKGTDQIILDISSGFQKIPKRYNLSKAKEIFNSLPQDVKNRTHKLICHGLPNGNAGNYYRWVKDSLTSIGMKIDLSLAEDMDIKEGNKDTTMIVFGRYVDSNPLASFAYYLPEASPKTLKKDDEYSTLFVKAENAESMEERSALIKQLSMHLQDRSIVVPLHQNYPIYYVSPRLKSIGVGEKAWTLNVSEIEMETPLATK